MLTIINDNVVLDLGDIQSIGKMDNQEQWRIGFKSQGNVLMVDHTDLEAILDLIRNPPQ